MVSLDRETLIFFERSNRIYGAFKTVVGRPPTESEKYWANQGWIPGSLL